MRPIIDKRGVIEFRDKNIIVFNGIGKPKTLTLPTEVVEWLRSSKVVPLILRELVTHYKFRSRLSHPGALRSLLLLLYSRAVGEAPYKVARRYGVAPEQLYRIERGLKKDGLYDFVLNALMTE